MTESHYTKNESNKRHNLDEMLLIFKVFQYFVVNYISKYPKSSEQ